MTGGSDRSQVTEVVGAGRRARGEATGPRVEGADRPERIGIFGGTFDPIHNGHVAAATAVRDALNLDRMLLVVANVPWQKEGSRSVTPAEDRLAMVEAAVADRDGLEPSRIEIDRGGPSYTVDTVDEIRRVAPHALLYLVVGADVVSELPTWHDEAALRRAVILAVVDRPGVPGTEPPAGWEWVSVAVPPFDVSSTELRSRLDAGGPVDELVPAPAVRCIERRGLYATKR